MSCRPVPAGLLSVLGLVTMAQHMKQAILCFAVMAVVIAGCRKKSSGPDASPSDPTPATGSSGSPAQKGTFTPAPAVPADSPAAKAHREMDQKLASGNPQLQLQVLDELVQAWVMSKGSPPKDLGELVKAKMLNSVPPAPPGKRFAVDQKQGRVVLANQ